MSRSVIIYSGGLDSTVLLEYCIKNYDEVYALTFDYNQRHKKEVLVAESYIYNNHSYSGTKVKEHKIIDLGFFRSLAPTSALTSDTIDVPRMKDVIGEAQPVSYVSNRNMMLLSIACSYAEAVGAWDVYYGAVAVDNLSGYWDTTSEFVESVNNVLSLNRMNRIQVQAPLLFKSKKDIIEMGIELGVKFDNTWTCYEGKEISCGTCGSCAARIAGFKKAGLVDPLPYAANINW
jgi:7-cyano-7-deazaguanine synthase